MLHLPPASLNFPGMRSTSPRAPAVLANPQDRPEGITMPHEMFDPDPLKTVAVHKEQKHTHIYGFMYI